MDKKKNSVVNIIEGIVIAALIIMIAVMLFLCFSFGKKGAAPNIFGFTVYHTMAVNMEPEIPANSAVIAKASEKDNVKVGSAVLCKIGDDTVLTRVVQLLNENGEISYVVKFDTAPPDITFKIPKSSVIAKAIWTSKGLGSLLSFATSTFGIMLVIIIPSLVIIIFQVVRIINAKKAEEDAYSIDDLQEVMIYDDDGLKPRGAREPEQSRRQPEPRGGDEYGRQRETGRVKEEMNAPLPFENFSFEERESRNKTLSVDRNGRAELKFTDPDSSGPLFTRESMRPIRREEPAEETDTLRKEGEMSEASEEQNVPAFMSNVISERLADTVSEAEKPVPLISPVQSQTKTVHTDSVIRNARSIPSKAVVPKEKLAPPPKKSSSKTISELMSIIDAEESKLK